MKDNKKQKFSSSKFFRSVRKINIWLWVVPFVAILVAMFIWILLATNTDAREGLSRFILKSPDISGTTMLFTILSSLFIAGILYFYVDYNQHVRSFDKDVRSVKYPLTHHVKLVFIPRLIYNWKQGLYLAGCGLACFMLISIVIVAQVQLVFAYAPDEFVTTWKTDNPGTSASNQITIPTTGAGYNYNVDWGDASTSTGVTGNTTHTYASAGTYEVKITGVFPRIYFANGGDRRKILTIEQWGTNQWSSMASAFHGASNLTVPALDAPNLVNVTDMSSMFRDANSFNQNINSWDVSSVTNMSLMFSGSSSHNTFNQPLDSWDTSNVTNMASMFSLTNSFNQNINSWDVSSVTNMSCMFCVATAFNQPLNSWDVSSVTNMAQMFQVATAFNQPLNSWNVSNVTSVGHMFNLATAFNSSLTGWNLTSAITMTSMFEDATAFNQPINSWSFTSTVKYMDRMFDGATAFNQPLNSWNVSSVTTMYGMFYQATSFDGDITAWDTSSLTNMQWMFINATSFNRAIGNWNTSNVTNMIQMFSSATAFNQPLNSWDTSNVTNMVGMFSSATSFNQPLNSWDTGQVTQMTAMFSSATAFNQPLNSWDTSNVTNMVGMFSSATSFNGAIDSWNTTGVTDMSTMFYGATAFNKPVDDWDTSNVSNMSYMFYGATAFNQPLNSWDTSSVTDMVRMFKIATAFNGDISAWDTSSVTSMHEMFQGATAFNQAIGGWDVSNVGSMHGMFASATAFNQPLNSWNLASANDINSMFNSATAFNQPLNSWDVSNINFMGDMFYGATSFNQSLGAWDVSNVINMYHMLTNVPLSRANYDDMLSSWSNLNLQPDVTLRATISNYCTSESARASIISTYNWNIVDAGKECGAVPSVVTNDATNITDEQATLQGAVSSSDTPLTAVGFEWGETVSYGNDSGSLTTSLGDFSHAIALGECGQTYHYRAYATNAVGTAYGSDKTFVTDTCFKIVETEQPEEIDETTAVLKGLVGGEAAGDFVAGGFEWGETVDYGSSINSLTISGESFNHTTTFACDTQYHYRAFAVDDNDQLTFGANTTFTLPCPESAPANQAPSVAITAPQDNQAFITNETINLTADASDTDGTISEVSYYIDGSLIATLTSSPYQFVVHSSKAGVFNFIAVAQDNTGAETAANPVRFLVSAPSTTQSDSDDSSSSPSSSNSSGPDIAQLDVPRSLDSSLSPILQNDKSQDIKKIAQHIPWILLLLLAVGYLVLTYRQAKQNHILKRILLLTNQTHQNIEDFLNIVTHYLGTSVTLISLAAEGVQTEESEDHDVVSEVKITAENLKTTINKLILQLSNSVSLVKQELETGPKISRQSWLLWVLLPNAVVALVLLSYLGILGQLSGANEARLFVGIMFVGGMIATAIFFYLWQRQRRLHSDLRTTVTASEHALQLRHSFIQSTHKSLNEEAEIIEIVGTKVHDETFQKRFQAGLKQLQQVARAFTDITELTATVVPGLTRAFIPAREVIDSLADQANLKHIKLIVDVPATIKTTLLPSELNHILTTLVSNAISFSSSNSTVTVKARSKRQGFYITVKDEGAGISQEKLHTLMQPFSRATSTETYNYEGLGLNLYITRLIARKYGGSVRIQSSEGKGTVVTVKT